MQLNLDIFRDDKNRTKPTKWMTTRNQEDILKGKKYVKEKVLAPSAWDKQMASCVVFVLWCNCVNFVLLVCNVKELLE